MDDTSIKPHPGPQEEFLKSESDIAIYGGAAGGGKSFALLLEACRHIGRVGYSAVIFRRVYTSLQGTGSLVDLAREVYSRPGLFGDMTASPSPLVTFPNGSKIQFSHLQHAKDALKHRGREYAFIGWDELCEFEESQFWELFGRNRSTCGIRPYMRGTCNPDPDSFVRKLIDWWIGEDGFPIAERSGVLRYFVREGDELTWFDSPRPSSVSLTFIPARLEDNLTLVEKDQEYRTKLESLPRVERERLLGGNWNIKPSAGLYFRRSMFEMIEAAPTRNVADRYRCWDKAATRPGPQNRDPDWTVGVRYCRLKDGSYVVEDAVRLREGPLGVERAVINTAMHDGKKCKVGLWEDPGGAGKSDAQHFARLLSSHTVKIRKASKDKVTYAGPVSSQAEAGNVRVVRGAWNDAFFDILEAFPDGKHDDDVDALSLAHLLCADSSLAKLRKLATM